MTAHLPDPHRTAYVTPYRMPTNAYIEMQKDLARDGGFEPKPFSIRHLLMEGGLRGLLERHNIVLVQWLESRPFHSTAAGGRLSLRGSLLFAFYLLLLAVTPARVVFFVHDHAVHDTSGRLRRVSRRLVLLLCRVADLRVVHDPDSAALYRAHYLPHPLFWDRPDLPAQAGMARTAQAGTLRCLMLGAIRPYKAIDTILQAWPAGLPLQVAGRSSPALAARLRQIIAERGLADTVRLDATHQSDAAFDAHLCGCDVLILPHAPDTALVSGAFFEALGRVPYIVARHSRFIDWACREFTNVRAFDHPDELAAILDGLAQTCASSSAAVTTERALSTFGWKQCQRQWGAFFEHLAGGVGTAAVGAPRQPDRGVGPQA